MRFLQLGNYIGPLAADAQEGFIDIADAALVTLIQQAQAEGAAVTASLDTVPYSKVAQELADARAKHPYLQLKNELAKKAAEAAMPALDALAAYTKEMVNQNGTGWLNNLGKDATKKETDSVAEA